KVTCRDSGRTQRASGANPRTPSTNLPIRSRMDSSMSSAMKRRILAFLREPSGRTPDDSHQLSSDHVQRHLARVAANAFPVADELSFHDLGPSFAGQGMKY